MKIRIVPKAKLGYFRQELDNLNLDETVLQNVRRVSCQSEQVNRATLARMGFFQHDMDKKAAVLSGGERIKLSFAMLFVSDINVLLLDEPTNFLDIPSIQAIESMLQDYEGTVLFVTHDRNLIDTVADEVWEIAGGKISVV